MIIGLLRALYFFGPIMALAIVLMPRRPQLSWALWVLATVITAIHWMSYLTAQEDNANEVSIFGISVWTPLIITTALARWSEDKWRGWHPNPFISQGVVSLVCLLPSVIAFFIIR